jgi:arylsulfatase A-like enzyme
VTSGESRGAAAAPRAGAWFRLAVALGLAAGLAEAALRGVQRLRQTFTWVSPDVVWIAPLVNVLAFVSVAALLWGAGRVGVRARSVRVLTAACTFLFTGSALLSYEPLHPAAAMLLAAGLAAQASWLLDRRIARLDTNVRRTLPWLLTAAAILTIATGPAASVMEGRAERQLPAAPANAPDVLFLLLDSARAANLSVAGYDRPTTPNLERLASRGVYFERAVATSSWTLPSHATLFTGRYAFEQSADWRSPLDETHPTLAETFAGRGYSTAAFVSNVLYLTKETGIDRGFIHYDDYRVTFQMIVKASLVARQIARAFGVRTQGISLTERRWAGEINTAFLDWFAARRPGGQPRRPIFAFLNYLEPHTPYLPPSPFRERFGAIGPAPDIDLRRQWTPKEIEREKNGYDASLAALDHGVGELLADLERRGDLERTIVVITSDHGEMLGEHGLYDHANGLHWPLLHVPLLIIYPPGVPAGLRVAEPVTLRDLPATILELAGVRPASWPGESLTRFWNRGSLAQGSSTVAQGFSPAGSSTVAQGPNGVAQGFSPADPSGTSGSPLLSEISQGINLNPWLPASRGDMKSLVVGSKHYIRISDGTEELYDLETDPGETRNLITGPSDPQLPFFRDRLAAALDDDDGHDRR